MSFIQTDKVLKVSRGEPLVLDTDSMNVPQQQREGLVHTTVKAFA